jgi:hypothetical protein
MSSHAAFRPDSDLLPRAAHGDGAAALALLERHGTRLRGEALARLGDPDRASAAVVATFAALLVGALRPAPGAGLDWLRAAVAAQGEALVVAPPDGAGTEMVAGDDLVAALAERLPPAQGAALLAAHRAGAAPGDATSPAEPDVAFRPPVVHAPAALEATPPTLDELRRAVATDEGGARLTGGTTAAQRTTVPGRSLDRYIERPSPLRWVAPLALVAALVALWSWWQLPGRASASL